MTAGGFLYAEKSVTYTSGMTKREWALMVHLARCEAFLRASHRHNGGYWAPFDTEEWGLTEFSQSVPYGDGQGENVDVYIQDIHPLSMSGAEDSPAFVSFFNRFVNGQSAEYCIVTSRGFTCDESHRNSIDYGLFVNKKQMASRGGTNEYLYPVSCAHAFAMPEFGVYDLSLDGIAQGQLRLQQAFGYTITPMLSSGHTYSSQGVVQNPINGVTYTFGYAVKDYIIETFEKQSNDSVNRGFKWGIIGEIFDENCFGGEERPCRCGSLYPPYSGTYENSPLSNDNIGWNSTNSKATCGEVITGTDHKLVFPTYGLEMGQVLGPLFISLTPAYNPFICRTSTPDKIPYSAGCISFVKDISKSDTNNSKCLDGNGLCTKGYISTDCLRVVSSTVCSVGGATFQGGNFVSMYVYITTQNAPYGILLGWDPSNPSIV